MTKKFLIKNVDFRIIQLLTMMLGQANEEIWAQILVVRLQISCSFLL